MPLGTRHRVKPVTAIVFSVALFVILDLSILILNFQIAKQIDEDSLAINLAGRQRMLSQQMAKQVLEQISLPKDSSRWKQLELEFQQSQQLFESTLQGFIYGGAVINSSGKPDILIARQSHEVIPLLKQAEQQWQTYQADMMAVRRGDAEITAMLLTSSTLLATVNQLTTALEQIANNKTRLLRIFQSTAVLLALLNFALILWQVRRRVQSIENNNEKLRHLVERMNIAVFLFDEKERIQYANTAAGQLFGFTADELIGKTRDGLFISLDDCVLGKRSDGTNFTAHIEVSELVFEDDPIQVVTIIDVTQHQEKGSHWRHLAYHDSLTGLPNRLLFEHRIKQDLASAKRHNEFIALLTIDLDNFKIINDNYGHVVGDDVLRTVANRFRDNVRTEDLVARLGGDEFVIVLNRFPSEPIAKAAAQSICGVLMKSLLQPVITVAGDITVGGSIGVSFFPTDGDELVDIMHQSDASMYRAKLSGVGCEILVGHA